MTIIRDEILEYPYTGFIERTIESAPTTPVGGDEDDEPISDDEDVVVVYEGMMDEHMVTDDEGHTMQTASYIISIPLTKDDDGNYIIPRKGDRITLNRYGEVLKFSVDNAEPSQLGGVSIYTTRKIW